MIFKSVQVDGFVKKPDEKIRAVLVYGSNDGLRRDTVKRLAAAVCPDLNDPFRAAELAGGDLAADVGTLYGEFNGQSLTGGRRVIIVNDAGNDLTKAIRKMLDESPNTGNLLILSGAGSLNKKSSLVKLAEDSEDMAAVACYEDKNEDICSVLKSMGMTFEPAAVQLLCSRLSGDRMVNLNELEKLATYMGTAKNVTAEIVGKIISDASDAALDDIYYAALGGDKVKALSFYTRYVNEGNEPAAVVRGLTYHLMKLLVCRAGIENGESVDRAMQRLMPRIQTAVVILEPRQTAAGAGNAVCRGKRLQDHQYAGGGGCQHAAVAAGGRGQTPGLENDQRKVCRVYQYLAAEIRYRTQY